MRPARACFSEILTTTRRSPALDFRVLVLGLALTAIDASRAPAMQQQIKAEHVLTLGSEGGQGIIPGMVRSVVRDRAGQFWITVYSSEPPIVFDAQGRFRFTVGRKGRGPGEFTGALQVLATEGDSVLVYDPGNGRINAFDPDGEFRSSRNLVSPAYWDLIVLSNGYAVVNGDVRTRQSAGFPIHVYSADQAQPLRSFGVEVPILRPAQPRGMLNRSLAAGSDGTFWTAAKNEYLLERWDIDGRRLARIERRPAWFQPMIGDVDVLEGEPYAQVIDVDSDESGRLWVSAVVPEDDWEKATTVSTDRTGRTRRRIEDYSKAYDAVIEVLDPRSGEMLAHGRFDSTMVLFLGDGYIATVLSTRDLVPVVEIWRMHLEAR